MNFPQLTVERMGLSSNRYRTSLVALCTAFLILCLVTYKGSIFNRFERFSKDKVFGGRVQNLTYESMGPTAQVITGSDAVSKNDSFTNSTNESTSDTRNRATTNKLLDGLLASGFDETQCLSRFQSYLYRKASPHKPSPYLISKLRKYEDLHRRCGPHTRFYNRTMTKLTRYRNKGATTACNYIVWTPVNGLGNRMVSMASAFLYALLTDRVLMVGFGNDMVGLFCEPFQNSSWILPSDFPFRNNQRHINTYQSMLKKDRENSSGQIWPSVLHLNLQHTSDDPEKFFHCDHSHVLLRKVALLILRSDQYFIPSIFMIPSFNQELSNMFPEKDTVFYLLGRYLFLPSNEAWGIISRFYQAYMAKADERIGLQIRVFSPDLTPNQVIMDQILKCTLKNKVLPELDMGHSVTSPRQNQTLKSVLVASLYSDFGENLRTMYLTKSTITGDIVGVYQPSHEEHQKFYDNMHNIKALTEMYLLSLCDVLVTSSVSSFGYVAQSLGALKPWILYKLLDKNIPDPPCVRDFSMEPCFHNPPKHDCMAKPMDDYGKAFPYTRACLDYGFGTKLVNDHE